MRRRHVTKRKIVCLLIVLAVLSLVPYFYAVTEGNLLAVVVVPLRTIAPWFLWGHWSCFSNGPVPLNEEGVSAHKFGVALIHVPHDFEAGFDDYQRQVWQIAQRNRLHYCKQHGYTFINGTSWAEQHPTVMKKLHGRTHWLKSLVLQDVFAHMPNSNSTSTAAAQYPHLDWILFLDTDIMILNHDIRLEQIVAGAQPNDGIIVTTEADRVNAGAFVVANTKAGRAILDVWATGADTVGWSDQKYFHTMFDDQQELRINQSWPGGVRIDNDNWTTPPTYRIVKPCALQCCSGLEYSQTRHRPYTEGFYAKGDFAVHFFGADKDKLSLMKIAERSLGFFS